MVKDNLPQKVAKEDFRFIYVTGYSSANQKVIVNNKGKIKIELKFPETISASSFSYSFYIYGRNDIDSSTHSSIGTMSFTASSYESQSFNVPNYDYIEIEMRDNSGSVSYVAFGVTLYS